MTSLSALSWRCRRWTLGLVLLAAATVALPAALQAAPPRKNEREMRAREDFAAGRYREALDIYVKLYAEQLHPNYLRNIGRCYQNLEDPEPAISSFREYLRKAKNVTPAEHTEIEGYIAEMEQLKKKRAAASAPKVETPPKSEPTTVATRPLTPTPPPPPPPDLIGHEQPAAAEAPVYKRWWFWTIIGGAVAAGAVAVVLARGSGTTDLCPSDRKCVQ
jgi:tetratricopeptide (TPR) repeat protein